MIARFQGESGRRLRIETLLSQKMVSGNRELAEALDEKAELIEVSAGESIITQGDFTNDIYFILVGEFSVIINGREIARRGAGVQVGEMAVVEPSQARSATLTATVPSLVAKVTEAAFDELGSVYPQLYKAIAQVLSRRLLDRNRLVRPTNGRIRLFIISSAEALPIARLVHTALQHDSIDVILWSEGVFKVTNYTLQTLEDEVDQADFAVAITHSDDMANIREVDWPVPRDNVIFELGLFMGRIGRQRAILMEPRGEKLKLPSDLAGITTIPYRYVAGKDAANHIAPAVNALRDHMTNLGPQ